MKTETNSNSNAETLHELHAQNRYELITIDLLDKLIYCNQALAEACLYAKSMSDNPIAESRHICRSLSMSCINNNFDHQVLIEAIDQTLLFRQQISEKYEGYQSESKYPGYDHETWKLSKIERPEESKNSDWYALKEYLLWTLKGLSCYSRQAAYLGFEEVAHYEHIEQCLASLLPDISQEKLWEEIESTSQLGLTILKLLDTAKSTKFGPAELTLVSATSSNRPGILVCGEDLKDLEQVLIQSEEKGVDVYTHDAMICAHAYPELKQYTHLVSNYGLSWYNQKEDFSNFHGAILLTTGPLVVPENSLPYNDHIFTTGVIAVRNWRALNDKLPNGAKDFSELVSMAQHLEIPAKADHSEQTIGFSHQQTQNLIPRLIHALKHKEVEGLVLINGCDAPFEEYNYYKTLVDQLPKNYLIMVAGSIKYRFNQEEFGSLSGIPRLLDAGQNSDVYSWIVFLRKVTEQMGLNSLADLPLKLYSAWYDQKSIFTHLSLLHVGFKEMELGPIKAPFISEAMEKVFKDKYHCTIRNV